MILFTDWGHGGTDGSCWTGGYSFGLCCSSVFGSVGKASCWMPPKFTFDTCCVVARGDNQEFRVGLHDDVIVVDLAAARVGPRRRLAWPLLSNGMKTVSERLAEVSFDYMYYKLEDPRRMRRVWMCPLTLSSHEHMVHSPAVQSVITNLSNRVGLDNFGRQCEAYSYGDGLCVLEVASSSSGVNSGRDTDSDHSSGSGSAQRKRRRRRSATLVRSTCPAPLWVCPLRAPMAFLLLPKAASTSLANWIGRLDGLHGRWAALRTAYNEGGDDAVAQLLKERFANRSFRSESAAFGERARGARSERLATTERRSTVVFSELREGSGAEDIVPPAADCPACCNPGQWRTRVVVGRHPLARLVSYFGMAWVGNKRRGNFSSWRLFPVWVRHVAAHVVKNEASGFPGGASAGVTRVRAAAAVAAHKGRVDVVEDSPAVATIFDQTDDFHTQSLAAMLIDHGVGFDDIQVLRLENLEVDFLQLQRALRERHDFRKHLPPLRRQRLEGDGGSDGAIAKPRGDQRRPVASRHGPISASAAHRQLATLWKHMGVRAAVLHAYAAEFAVLGYDVEGGDLNAA
eukprot:TRINITY_DN61895_c0_g1_i1.p1 TRINITY_DN61895_c0_g1~~TRINITY_DN61895_c0_g1_i1.p1  ORF type:complete len:571 (+),score=71.06 TRINITY_DN61895_c0_g1_i1:190-1902(+)